MRPYQNKAFHHVVSHISTFRLKDIKDFWETEYCWGVLVGTLNSINLETPAR